MATKDQLREVLNGLDAALARRDIRTARDYARDLRALIETGQIPRS